jgi:hypothetical protein
VGSLQQSISTTFPLQWKYRLGDKTVETQADATATLYPGKRRPYQQGNVDMEWR